VLCHHLGQHDRYSPALQHRLQAAIVASLGRLPVEPLQRTVADLDPERAATVENLLQRAA
jgi:hypothetical protein